MAEFCPTMNHSELGNRKFITGSTLNPSPTRRRGEGFSNRPSDTPLLRERGRGERFRNRICSHVEYSGLDVPAGGQVRAIIPVRVESTFPICALIGMRAEQIALRLDQVGWQTQAAIAVVVRQ